MLCEVSSLIVIEGAWFLMSGFLAQEGVFKDYVKTKCLQLLFGWECCSCWYRFAHLVELVIMDAFVDLFITLCIVINTLFMAMENAGMSDTLARTLVVGNYVRLIIIAISSFKLVGV